MSFVLNVRRKLIQLEQLKENIHENNFKEIHTNCLILALRKLSLLTLTKF